jgi:hypothetical protein
VVEIVGVAQAAVHLGRGWGGLPPQLSPP